LIKTLAELSETVPKFYSNELGQGSINKEFEIKHYSRQRDIEVAKLKHRIENAKYLLLEGEIEREEFQAIKEDASKAITYWDYK
jgi:hypothetical protein